MGRRANRRIRKQTRADKGTRRGAKIPRTHLAIEQLEARLLLSGTDTDYPFFQSDSSEVDVHLEASTATGSPHSQGDYVHHADRLRKFLDDNGNSIDGTGVTVAIISDSFNALCEGVSTNCGSGANLPSDVLIVTPNDSSGKPVPLRATDADEGRAMAEIVHDLAPGAKIAFTPGDIDPVVNAQRLRELVVRAQHRWSANKVIVIDDVRLVSENTFQVMDWEDEIETLVADEGIAYFAAAGNRATAWENLDALGGRVPLKLTTGVVRLSGASISGNFHDFSSNGGAPDFRQLIRIPANTIVTFTLAWNQPRNSGVTTDLDLLLLDNSPIGTVLNPVTTNPDGSFLYQGRFQNVVDQLPFEIVVINNRGMPARNANVSIRHIAGPAPTAFKWVSNQNVQVVDAANSSGNNTATIMGHVTSPNVMAIAAAPFSDQRTPHTSFSRGPSTVLFDVDGNPITPAAAQVRTKPDLLGIDSVSTSIPGFSRFNGTSAAAPHVGAVAALLWQAEPALSTTQLYQRLKDTAQNIEMPGEAADGWDNVSGYGLVDAYRAVYPVPTSIKVSDEAGRRFVEDFDTGSDAGRLGSHWEVNTFGAGRISVDSSGEDTNVAKMMTLVDGSNGLAEMILHLDLTGMNNAVLQYMQKESGDSDSPMPATFHGHHKSDGVALSVDGVRWFRLENLIGDNSSAGFKTHSHDLHQFISSLSTYGINLTLGSNVLIKFQNYGDSGIGFVFDGIAVFDKQEQVRGRVFEDENMDGAWNPFSESGIDGVSIEVRKESDPTFREIINADSDGRFVVGGLNSANDYYLQFATTGRKINFGPLNPDLLSGQQRTAIFSVTTASGGQAPNFEVGFTSGLKEKQAQELLEKIKEPGKSLQDSGKKTLKDTKSGGLSQIIDGPGARLASLIATPNVPAIPFVDDISQALDLPGLMDQISALLYERPIISAPTAPNSAVLSNDESLYVNVDGLHGTIVEVQAASTVDNNNILDLASDINNAIQDAGLEEILFADIVDGKLSLSSTPSASPPSLTVTTLSLTGPSAPVAFGQLTGNLQFTINVTQNGSIHSTNLQLPKSNTSDNIDSNDLASDLADAMIALNVGARVTSSGRIQLYPKDSTITGLQIVQTGSQTGSLAELGFANGADVHETFPNLGAPASALGFVAESVVADKLFNTLDSLEDALETAYATLSNSDLDSVDVDANLVINEADEIIEFDVRVIHPFETSLELDLFQGIDLDLGGIDLGTVEIAALADAKLTLVADLDFRMGIHYGELGSDFDIDSTTLLSDLNGGDGVDLLVGMTANTGLPTNGQPGADVSFSIDIHREGNITNSVNVTLAKDSDPADLSKALEDRKPHTSDNSSPSMLVDDLNHLFSQTTTLHPLSLGRNLSDFLQAGIVESVDQFGNVTEKLTVRAIDPDVRKLRLTNANILGFTGVADSHYDDLTIALSNGHIFGVNLDGADHLGDIKQLIEAASIVGSSPTVMVTINTTSDVIDVVDLSSGTHQFTIIPAATVDREQQQSTNPLVYDVIRSTTSRAGLGLGVLGTERDGDINGDNALDASDDDGKIEGRPLHGLTTADRVYIFEQATGQAADHKHLKITATVESDVDVTGALGEMALDLVTSASDPLSISVAADVHLTDPSGDGKLFLSEFTTLNLLPIVGIPEFSAEGSGTFELAINVFDETDRLDLTALFGETEPTVTLSFSFDSSAGTFQFTPTANFETLSESFGKFGIEDLVAVLGRLVDELKSNPDLGFLNKEIPIIDGSLSDVIDFADSLLDAANQLVFGISLSDLDDIEAARIKLEQAISNLGMSLESRATLFRQLDVLRRVATKPDQDQLVDSDGQPTDYFDRLPARVLSATAQLGKLINRHVFDTTTGYEDLISAYKGLLKHVPALNSLEERIADAIEDAINDALRTPAGSPLTVDVTIGFADYDGITTTAEDRKDRLLTLGIELSAPELLRKKLDPEMPITAELGPVNLSLDTDLEVVVGGTIAIGMAVDPRGTIDDERFYLIVSPPISDDDDLVRTHIDLNVGIDSQTSGKVSFGSLGLIEADVEFTILDSVRQIAAPAAMIPLDGTPVFYREDVAYPDDGRSMIVTVNNENNDAKDVLSFSDGEYRLLNTSSPPTLEIVYSAIDLANDATAIIIDYQTTSDHSDTARQDTPGTRVDNTGTDLSRSSNHSANASIDLVPKDSSLTTAFTVSCDPAFPDVCLAIPGMLDSGIVPVPILEEFSDQGMPLINPRVRTLNPGSYWQISGDEPGTGRPATNAFLRELPSSPSWSVKIPVSFTSAVPFSRLDNDVDINTDVHGMVLGSVDGELLGNDVDNILVVAASLDQLSDPQVTFDPSALGDLFKLDFDLKTIVAGIDAFLRELEEGLRDEIISEMPLAGDGFDMEETFIGKLRKNFTQPLLDLLCNTDGDLLEDLEVEIERFIFEKLGPGLSAIDDPLKSGIPAGLNILGDQTGEGIVDLGFVDPNNPQLNRESDVQVTLTEDRFEIDIQLSGRDDFQLDFNFGPDFPLSGEGGLEFGYEYQVELGVGISRTEKFYFIDQRDEFDIDMDGDVEELIPEVSLMIDAGLAVDDSDPSNPIPTSLTLDLFGLEISATDILDGSETGTGISGHLVIDVMDANTDGRILLNELTSRPFSDVFDATLNANAQVNLALAAGVNDNIPSVETDLFVGASSGGPWTASLTKNSDGKYVFEQSGVTVRFFDLGINLGDFLSEHLGPVVRSVDKYIEPIKPVVELLTREVPGVSELSKAAGDGPVYFLDLAFLDNPDGGQRARKFVETVAAIINVIDTLAGIDPSDNLFLILDDEVEVPLGNDDDDGGGLAAISAGGVVNGVKNVGGKLGGLLDQLNEIGVRIHLLEDSKNIVNLLTGKPFDVVSWKLPEIELPFSFEKEFPVIPLPKINVRVGLDAEVFAQLSVGYDSHGIETGNFFHGIYFGDREEVFAGADIDEFGFSLSVRLAALLDLLVVKAGIEGEIVGNVVANWNDPDDDGKLHVDEITSIIRNDGIECLFDASGEVRAIVRAIWEFTIAGKTGSKEFINEQIASFTHACPKFETGHVSEGETLPGIDVASGFDSSFSEFNQAGTLVLHAGPFANLRGPGASSDTDEAFEVEKLAPGVYEVRALGLESRYSGVERIYFHGGIGQDRLELINVDDRVVAFGGANDDHLEGTKNIDFLDGGTGDDEIWARGDADFVFGGGHNDEIYGDLEPGNTNSTLWGVGAGDIIYAGTGNDLVYAADGGDTVYGEGGNDVIYADLSEANTPAATQGSDTVMAGAGDDLVFTGDFDDTILGEAGNDLLFGEAGMDFIRGGTGADIVMGMGDNDNLYGDSGLDVIVGGLGADELFGGRGNDILAGGLATEETLPNQGAPLRDAIAMVLDSTMLLPISDLVELEMLDYGSSDSGDTIWGEEDNDLLIGDAGGDSLFGGWGNDVIVGYRVGDDSSTDADEYIEGGPDDDFICATYSADEIYGGTADAGLSNVLASTPTTPSSGGFALASCLATAVTVNLPPTESSISGVKFNDLDGDGIRGEFEPLLADWTIHLLDPDGEIIDSVTTDADGAYTFATLPAGDYGLTEAQQTDWVQTTGDYTITLGDGENLVEFDFGNRFNGGTIAGQKWHDLDADGEIDAGEAGLNNWRIELLDSDGNVIDATITNAVDLDGSGTAGDDPSERGLYEFTDLNSGIYGVREVLLNDWVQRTPQLADSNALVYLADDGFSTTRSDANSPVVGTISSVSSVKVTLDIEHPRRGDIEATLVSPEGTRVRLFTNVGGSVQNFTSITLDEDDFLTPSIADISDHPMATVFRPEQSLQQLAGETVAGLWTLELYDGFEGEGGRLEGWSLNINGTNVVGGMANLYGARPTVVVEHEVQAGATVTQDFGNYKVGTVTGTKFLDSNANGVRDIDEPAGESEPGLAGVTIYVDLNDNERLDRGEPKTITEFDDPDTPEDETGRYTLGPIPPGAHVIREEVPNNHQQTFPDPAGALAGGHEVMLVSGQEVSEIDFGNAPPASVHGTKWLDENGNGLRDEGESGLRGFIIYADLNNNGQLDDDEPSTMSMGQSPATLLADANDDLQVNSQDILQWQSSYGMPLLPPNAGDFDQSGSVDGSDFLQWQQDFDGDQGLELSRWRASYGAVGLPGSTGDFNQDGVASGADFLLLQLNFGGTLAHEEGEYWLEVPPGEMTIREIVPLGFEQTFPIEQDHSLVIAPGQLITEIDFGNRALEGAFGSIHGHKWEDYVADGIRAPAESGIANVEIYLDFNNNGQLDAGEPLTTTAVDDPLTTEVDETGNYWFTGLERGNYVVREVVPEGAEQVYASSGFHAINLGHNERIDGVDFGNWLLPDPTGGDGNNDGFVDGEDLLLWLEGYGDEFANPSSGNFDGDGVSSGADFLNWQTGFTGGPLVAAGSSPPGLVALWDFEQTLIDTASAYDENVGVANDSLSGLPNFISGLVGTYALALEGLGGVTTAATHTTGDFDFAGFTIESFFKPTGIISQSLEGTIFKVFDPMHPSTGDVIDVRYLPPSGQAIDGSVEVTVRAGTSSQTFGFALVDPTQWSHVAIVGDGGENLQLFVNGIAAGALSMPGESIRFDQDDRLQFGGEEFAGLIDKAAVWNYELDGGLFADHFGNPQDCYGLTPATTTIQGFKFHDLDGDGDWEPADGEQPLDQWPIQIQVDGGLPQITTTNAQGEYSFSNISGITAVVSEIQQVNWLQTSDGGTGSMGVLTPNMLASEWTLDVSGHQDYYDVSFGNQKQVGSIHGHKFEDIDGNGVWDPGELPIADWVIEIIGGDLNGDGMSDASDRLTTVTNAMGEYWFSDLLAASYTVREVMQPGWMQTSSGGTGVNGSLTLTSGMTEWIFDLDPLEQYFEVNFGNQRDMPPMPLPDGDDTIYASAGDDVEVYGDNLVSNPLIVSVGSRRDTIFGQAGNDHLFGQEEDDILWGADSMMETVVSGDDDIIDGGLGVDEVRQRVKLNQTLTNSTLTGQGNDQLISIERGKLIGEDGPNAIDATAFSGPVRLFGEGGVDTLLGGANDDELDGGAGGDTLMGNAGDDRYLFTPITGGAETDTVVELAGEGNDTLDFSGLDTSITVNLAGGLTGNRIAQQPALVRVVEVMAAGQEANFENIVGTNQADALAGNTAANTIFALAGSDSVAGGAGNDLIDLGTGNADVADGGADDDVFVFADNWGRVTQLLGGGGSDTVDFSSVTTDLLFEIETLMVSTGGNTVNSPLSDVEHLVGGLADDTFRFVIDGSSLPVGGTIDGHAGSDWLDYIGYTTVAANVDLGAGTAAGTSQVLNVENVAGGAANDTIFGDANPNILIGRGGDDPLDGRAGSDVYVVLEGDDNDNLADSGPATDVDVLELSHVTSNLRVNVQSTQLTVDFLANGDHLSSTNTLEEIRSGEGNDEVLFFANATLPAGSLVNGGEGTDTLDYTNYSTGVLVNLSDQDHQTPFTVARFATGVGQVDGFENVVGTNLNDVIVGSDANNRLSALGGDDELHGLRGNDTLLAGPGDDKSYGGNGDDLYIVDPAFQGFAAIELRGKADAGQASSGGVDTLDLSSISAFDIFLDLRTDPNFENVIGSLSRFNELIGNDKNNLLVGGSLADKLSGGGGDDSLVGLQGADWIEGGTGDDILIGGLGDDGTGLHLGNARLFTGGPGRDILVGGFGQDRIDVNDDQEDILIGGTTAFDEIDTDPADRAAWHAIREIWGSASRNRTLRELLISTGVGTTADGGPFVLDATTVFDDADTDELIFDAAANSNGIDDWVFTGVGDTLTDTLVASLGASSSSDNDLELNLQSLLGVQQLNWQKGFSPLRRESLVERDRLFQEFSDLQPVGLWLIEEAIQELETSELEIEADGLRTSQESEEQEALDLVFAVI